MFVQFVKIIDSIVESHGLRELGDIFNPQAHNLLLHVMLNETSAFLARIFFFRTKTLSVTSRYSGTNEKREVYKVKCLTE